MDLAAPGPVVADDRAPARRRHGIHEGDAGAVAGDAEVAKRTECGLVVDEDPSRKFQSDPGADLVGRDRRERLAVPGRLRDPLLDLLEGSLAALHLAPRSEGDPREPSPGAAKDRELVGRRDGRQQRVGNPQGLGLPVVREEDEDLRLPAVDPLAEVDGLPVGAEASRLDSARLMGDPDEAGGSRRPVEANPMRQEEEAADGEETDLDGADEQGEGPSAASRLDRPRRRARHAAQVLQREGDVGHRLEPRLRSLLQTVRHDSLESRRNGPFRAGQLFRLLLQDRRHRLDRRLPAERPLPAQHLVKHDAECEDVGPVVGRFPPHLLGAHVAHRAENRPLLRRSGALARAARRQLRLPRLRGRHLLRQTEVEHLHVSVGGHEDVLRLHVPVDDPVRVGGAQARRQPDRDLDGPLRRKGAGLQLLP